MTSKIIDATTRPFDPKILSEAVELLKKDQVVAIPTETVYGLAANALSVNAVKKIFDAKCRPMDNPLIVHISSKNMLDSLIEKPPNFSLFEKLISVFWPGALTLLFPKSSLVPDTVTSGLSTVAIRYPAHPITISLIEQCGFPFAAPSANLSGRPSPTEARHVFDDLQDKVPLIIDGGPCAMGLESTVVNLLCDPPIILRPGSVTYEMLKPYVPNLHIYRPTNQIELDPLATAPTETCQKFIPLSPGMKYRHYSPHAEFYLLERSGFDGDKLPSFICRLDATCRSKNITGSIILDILPAPKALHGLSNLVVETFSDSSYHVIAKELFSKLRHLDSLNVDFILMFAVAENNEGSAIMNRALKASHSMLMSEDQVFSVFDN